MERTFRSCITEERERGRTVLLSSHILAEVEALCDRVSIIGHGRTVETGTLAELRHLTRTSIQAELAAAPEGFASLAGVHSFQAHRNQVRFAVDNTQLDDVLKHLTRIGVRSLVCQPPTLEELFLRQYGKAVEATAEGS
jgi:ABC-2 type transport system ATP-binding protein